MIDLSVRNREREIIDDPEKLSSEELRRTLGALRWVNQWLGGRSACMDAVTPTIEEIVRERPGQRVSLLDAGSGAADIPAAIVQWGADRGIEIQATAIDFNFEACRSAASATSGAVDLAQADIFRLPFGPKSFDIVLCSELLHHFSDEQVIAVLQELRRTSRRAVVVTDLERHWLAWLGIRTLVEILRCPDAVRNDGPLSVRKAFRREELARLIKQAGGGEPPLRRRWAFRWAVVIPG